jgi:sua5/yciO/yrdC/ywlC family protein
MKSIYFNEEKEVKIEEIKEAANGIKEGKLVLFPTETVYGIGANALDTNAVQKIFVAKGRASDNPLIVHISNINMLEQIVENIGEIEKRLINKFWPGPLTIIFNRKSENIIPNSVTAGLNTVGVRMPSNEIARELIELSGVPIAAPSANVSGRPSGTNVQDIIEELDGKVHYIIDGGKTIIGLESTVIRVIDKKIEILRPGKITLEELESVANEVEVNKNVFEKVTDKPVASPGMKYKHYAPKTKCVLVYSNDKAKMINKINEISNDYKNVVVLGTQGNMPKYISKNKLSMGATLEDVAQNIFSLLRKADKCNADLVIIEGVTKQGLGLAIINRLIRACEYNYIEI